MPLLSGDSCLIRLSLCLLRRLTARNLEGARRVRFGSERSRRRTETGAGVLARCLLRLNVRPSIQGTHMLERVNGAISGILVHPDNK
jgi:hypothetical protein